MEDQTQNINVDISQTEPIICSECGNDTFLQVYYVRKVSAVIAGKESVVPIPTFECSRCGKIPKEFEPKTL